MLPGNALLGLDDIFPGVLVNRVPLTALSGTRRFVAQGNIHSDSFLVLTGTWLNVAANGGNPARRGRGQRQRLPGLPLVYW